VNIERHPQPEELSHYLCIGCPLGCRLEVVEVAGEIVEVRGQGCKKGDRFARQEHIDPRRVLTTTVAVRGGVHQRVPVRSAGDIPKSMVRELAALLHQLSLDAPVTIGQVVLTDALGTGVDVVASRDLARREGWGPRFDPAPPDSAC
jgi:CxxC motif-containing protein